MDYFTRGAVPFVHKWKSRTSLKRVFSENVRAQIQFSSHWRHCVSVRGRIGEWLHQYSGVCSSCLTFRSHDETKYIIALLCNLLTAFTSHLTRVGASVPLYVHIKALESKVKSATCGQGLSACKLQEILHVCANVAGMQSGVCCTGTQSGSFSP